MVPGAPKCALAGIGAAAGAAGWHSLGVPGDESPSAVTGVAAARTHTVRDPNPSRGSPAPAEAGAGIPFVLSCLAMAGLNRDGQTGYEARPPPDSRPPAGAGLLDATTTYRR